MISGDLDLDGRVFVLVSSTASRVDPDRPTRFSYRESQGVVWGEYAGDTVAVGRFAGARRDDVLDIGFGHALESGGPAVQGTATSRIETGEDGFLRLVEEFEVAGVAHRSICVEVPSAR